MYWNQNTLPLENQQEQHYNKTGDSWTWARYVGKFKADGIVYDVYHKSNHGDESGVNSNKWTYTAIVARKPFLQGTLNVHLFIDYLISKKILTKDNYIANLELGNEVRDGTGSAVIKKYDVKVE